MDATYEVQNGRVVYEIVCGISAYKNEQHQVVLYSILFLKIVLYNYTIAQIKWVIGPDKILST